MLSASECVLMTYLASMKDTLSGFIPSSALVPSPYSRVEAPVINTTHNSDPVISYHRQLSGCTPSE